MMAKAWWAHAVWLVAGLLLCGALWHPGAQAQTPVREMPLHITEAQTLAMPGRGYTPPPYEADQAQLQGTWQSVSLPHALTRHLVRNTDGGDGSTAQTVVTWYRMQAPALPASANPRYLYVPRWKTDGQIAVYGDGRLLYQSHASMLWNGWNIPLWIAVDQRAEAVAPRTILVRIERPWDSGGGISSMWLGESDGLSWRYRIRQLLQVQLPYAGSAAFLAVGLFSLFVWFRLRSETEYLLFFYISVASFIRTLHFHVGDGKLIMSDAWFTWLTINSLAWMTLILHLFPRYLHRKTSPSVDYTVSGLTACIGIVTLPVFSGYLNAYALSPLVYIALMVMGIVVGAAGFHQSRRAHSRDGLLLSIWVWCGILLGGYDWLLQNNYVDIESVYVGPYINIGAFLILMHIVFRRYVAAHTEVKQANANLQLRLREREEELLESHQQLREIALRQTLSDERQRLMQDMHDGMGSSLLTALLAVEKGRIDASTVAAVLKGCIDDLKLAIDSMEPVQADLLLLLATLRFRLGPRLEGAGIALRWEIEMVPALDWLDPRNALHILRILQEAFTNIIKHTHATEIRVSTAVDKDHVVVTVADNGQGFSVAQGFSSAGKGLGNQVRRAESIGAEVRWNSSDAGTCLTLHLPIQRPAGV